MAAILSRPQCVNTIMSHTTGAPACVTKCSHLPRRIIHDIYEPPKVLRIQYNFILDKNWVMFTETKMSSFWRNFNHCLHWKLSCWQLPVQPVMKISSKWRHFRFSVDFSIIHMHVLFILIGCIYLCARFTFNQTFIRVSLLWGHNERDRVSNHQRLYCLLNRLFRRRSKITSKLRVTGLCAWNSPVTGELPAQMASNAENVSIWWRHHDASNFSPSFCSWLSKAQLKCHMEAMAS